MNASVECSSHNCFAHNLCKVNTTGKHDHDHEIVHLSSAEVILASGAFEVAEMDAATTNCAITLQVSALMDGDRRSNFYRVSIGLAIQ